MVDPNTRQGKRTPVTLKIKFKSETLEQFIERYAVDVSQGGIFIRTKEPLAVGTQMKFEFQLRDASPLIAGEGTVVWTRENDPSRPAIAPGMGVRFDRLAEGSQSILERILAEKAKQAPQRPAVDTMKPPLFTDTPTRVAPAPMQEALLGHGDSQRHRSRRNSDELGHSDSHTPLPKPMPFHSDADEFPDEAFEEATKVRALDELIAQTAGGTGAADELAARRSNGRSDESVSERAETLTESANAAQQRRERAHPTTGKVAVMGMRPDARGADAYEAPDLPNPPEPAMRLPAKLLDTSPSPRIESGQAVFGSDPPARTRLGVEPARARSSTPPLNMPHGLTDGPAFTSSPASIPVLPSAMRSVASEQTQPARMPPLRSSNTSAIIILILLILAAGGAAVWFLVLRPQAAATSTKPADSPAAGSEAVAAPAGSGGPAEVAGTNGTASPVAGAAPAATPNAPKAPIVDTVIGSNADGARVEIKGTDQAGPAPFTAKLESGKSYKVRVAARGFAALELDIKGGDDKPFAKLVGKPRLISIASDPSGALILVDGVATGRTTPSDFELTAAQAAKKSVRVQLRKSGYRSVNLDVDAGKFTEDDTKLTAALDAKLAVQQASPSGSRPGSAATPAPPKIPAPEPTGSDTGSSSEGPVTTPSGGSEGSAPPAAPAPPAAEPAPTTPPAPGSASEPEPSFNKPQ